MKKIVILGSTGKIGQQALEVIRSYPSLFQVIGLACKEEGSEFLKQIKEFKPKITCIFNQEGEEKLIKVATHPEVDLVLVAVVGLAGLKPTLAAVRAKKDIALATKEVLVIAGGLVMSAVLKNKVNLIPVDSEHSAIWQCLKSGKQQEVKQIFLTMGKGPMAKMSVRELEKVNLKTIFNRPHWTMGQKIAVDSATGMNKAFEVIEARWLFDLKPEQIKIIVHPEYLCHSLVEFRDAGILAEFGSPQMTRYIQYALFYPNRQFTKVSAFTDLIGKKITFANPPVEKFPCLKLGWLALEKGGTLPAVMHGADMAAVEAFVADKIKFTDIYGIIFNTMTKHKIINKPKLDQLIEAENWGRQTARKLIKGEIN